MTKHCPRCKTTKPTSDFGRNVSKSDGLSSYCSDCVRDYSKQWKNKNRDRTRRTDRFSWVKTKYGLSKDEYVELIEKQDSKCAICLCELDPFDGKTNTHVDHCHASGKVRGILCRACNTALGSFQDDIDTLRRAIHYLTSSQ